MTETLPSRPESVRQARTAVMVSLIGVACTTSTIEVARLLVSELATNAIRHARSDSFTVEIEVVEPLARIGVHDDDPTGVPAPQQQPPEATSGRGLGLIDTMAERWSCDEFSDPPGKTVWFELACA